MPSNIRFSQFVAGDVFILQSGRTYTAAGDARPWANTGVVAENYAIDIAPQPGLNRTITRKNVPTALGFENGNRGSCIIAYIPAEFAVDLNNPKIIKIAQEFSEKVVEEVADDWYTRAMQPAVLPAQEGYTRVIYPVPEGVTQYVRDREEYLRNFYTGYGARPNEDTTGNLRRWDPLDPRTHGGFRGTE